MIKWKELTLEDRDEINKHICASGCHGADYSFANNYMWRHEYQPRVFFNGSRILVWSLEEQVYAYPKGDGDVRPSIELLLEEAHEKGEKLQLRGLTDKTLNEFLPIYGERFEIIEDRDNADYIYSADKLCNLPGRHLASKRNHINKFLKNGDWELRKISSDNLEEAKQFLEAFYEAKGQDLEDEKRALSEMFENFDALGFRAAILLQNDKPVAFSAGTCLDEVVFDVHFEKAMPDVDGAYAMINREFARMIVAEFPEIGAFNREEDMGIEGLRKAKLSYHPDIILMKYFAREK